MQRSRRRTYLVSSALSELVIGALDDLKGQSIKCMDVRHLTSVTDVMVIVTGRSDRHVRALAESIVESCKRAGERSLGVEGQDAGEWVLVALSDVAVHFILQRVREFYNLEKLCDIPARPEAGSNSI